jgi:hypothetical protein
MVTSKLKLWHRPAFFIRIGWLNLVLASFSLIANTGYIIPVSAAAFSFIFAWMIKNRDRAESLTKTVNKHPGL